MTTMTTSDDLDRLPGVISIMTRAVRYVVPRIFYVGAERREVRDAVEITVHTEGPLPVRALSPALWVGDVPVHEMEAVARYQYRFYALEPGKLSEGAPLALGWAHHPPAARVTTRHRLRLGPGSVT
jgi:hypothetical protein